MSRPVLFTLYIVVLSLGRFAKAEQTYGRITLGSYAAIEKYNDLDSGSDRNDFMTASARLYFRSFEMGSNKNWEFATDIRDKHDFFDKLNQEKLQLDPVNTVQLRQFDVKYESPSRFLFVDVGRFAVSEAGSAYCDGAELGIKGGSGWALAGFGGYNPKRPDQSYVTFNSNSYTSGAFFRFQNPNASWDQTFYTTLAHVTQSVGSDIDRQYVFNNLVYQYSAKSHLWYLLYVDFVPHTYVQTANVNWLQGINDNFSININALGVDVIEYLRRQDVREQLQASPYKEASIRFKQATNQGPNVYLQSLYGERQSDQLIRREQLFGFGLPRFFSVNVDLSGKIGYRDNFNSKDSFAALGLGYFSDLWELSFEVQSGEEVYANGDKLHPLLANMDFGFYVSRKLFFAMGVEQAQDEQVKISSGFLKLSYRFGNIETPPIRDGVTPRGRL
jgi:hypothetical protein